MSTPVKIVAGRRPDLHGPADRPFRPLTAAERVRPIFGLLESRRGDYAGRTAIFGPGGATTYGGLLDRSLAVASRLYRLVGASREPVVVLASQGMNQIVAILACLRLGLPYVPLDPRHSPLRHRQVMAISRAQAVICEAETRATAISIARGIPVLDIGDSGGGTPGPLPELPDARAVANIIFTSGSTGAPKGVHHTQASLLSSAAMAIDLLHIGPDDRLVVVGSLAVVTSGSRLLGGALAGATLLPLPNGIALPDFLELCTRHGATVLSCYVGFARAIALHPKAADALRRVRAAIVFGDIAEWQDLAAMRRVLPDDSQLCILYGTTESDMTVAWYPPRDAPTASGRVPIGYALPGADLWLDRRKEPATDGSQVGELLAGGDRMAIGYWRYPEQTEARFAPHPQDPARRIYRTGDLLRLHPDGLLEYVGRRDNQVKVRGWRVELEDIEAVARRMPGVAGAGAVARRNAAGIVENVVLHVTAAPDTAPNTGDLAARIRKALPRHMWPAEIRLVAVLPRTETGKLDRGRLAELDAELRGQPSPSGKRVIAADQWSDELSRRIARMIASNLNLKAMEPEDNFIDLGGDSLEALNVAVRIEKSFGVTIDPSELLEAKTVGATVADIAAMTRAASPQPV